MPKENQNRVLGLIKFGEHSRIKEFVNRGLLYMNTLDYFKRWEVNQQRSDKDEGVNWCMQPDCTKLSVEIDGEFQEIKGIAGPITYHHPVELKTNVFCMYAIRPNFPNPSIDPRNFEFGDSFAILINGDDFLNRVQSAARNSGQQITWRRVTYVDRSLYNGPIGVFRKFAEFSHQNEFRIALFPGYGKPYRLEVGDLSDIATIGPSAELNDRLKWIMAY